MSGKYVARLPRSMPVDQARALSDVFQDLSRDATQFRLAADGAVVRSAADKLGEVVSVKDFGAVGDGVADDTTAFINALSSGNKQIIVPYGLYLITSKLTVPTGTSVRGIGFPTIKKNANIDLLDMSAEKSEIHNLNLQGNGANFTGRGIVISGGYEQKIFGCYVMDFSGYCLECTANDAGMRMRAFNTDFRRTILADKAIKLPTLGTIESNGNRYFIECGAQGGAFMDMGSAANTQIISCNFSQNNGLTMDAFCSRSIIASNRIAILSGSISVQGVDHNIVGNAVAGSITLESNTQRCVVGPNNLLAGATITDNSISTGDNVNEIYNHRQTFTPIWKGAVSDPSIGNGLIAGSIYRNGRVVTVNIKINAGSTTTFGSGGWYFELPSPYNVWVAKDAAVGTVRALDTGTAYRVGACSMIAGSKQIRIYSDGGVSEWSGSNPHTWASGDELYLTITFEIS